MKQTRLPDKVYYLNIDTGSKNPSIQTVQSRY
jgi:hypothetical protein